MNMIIYLNTNFNIICLENYFMGFVIKFNQLALLVNYKIS